MVSDWDSRRYSEVEQIQLTPREHDILELLCEGYSNRAIAEKLVIAMDTVKWYNKQIYGKLAVSNRTQAVLTARENKIIALSDSVTLQSNRLPNPITSFIGRRKALQQIMNLLQAHRLVSIVGPGGVGKTRLAIQITHQHNLPDIETSVYVPLTPVSSYMQFLQAIATAIGVTIRDQTRSQQQIIQLLRQQPVLLILDNFEHILQANVQLNTLLQAVPDLHVLVTSRERLNLSGEMVFTLFGLEAPQNDQISEVYESDAVDLFINRVRYVDNDFEPTHEQLIQIAHICRLLGGMPLAIEHLASWMYVLDLATIISETEQSLNFLETNSQNVEERHRSMRAVIDRSWQRLSTAEQQILMNLSVFRGGFQRDAAEIVAGATLKTLSALVTKSFVYRIDEVRYDIHELQRQFVLEKLQEEKKEKIAREKHAHFYAELIDNNCPKRYEFAEYNVAGLKRLDAEYDNIREAVLWSLQQDHACLAMQILAEGKYFFIDRGHHVEAGEWILEALKLCTNPDPLLQIKANLTQGLMSEAENKWQLFLEDHNEYLIRAEHVASPEHLAHTHVMLGSYALQDNRFDEAQQHIETAINIIKEHRHQFPGTYGTFYKSLSDVALAKGDLTLAIEHLQKSCDIWREFKGRFVGRLVRLIRLLRRTGRILEIPPLLQEALDNSLYFSSPVWTMWTLHETAHLFHISRNLTIATQLSAVSWQLYRRTNHPVEEIQLIMNNLQQDMTVAKFDKFWQKGLALPVNEAISLAQEALEDLSET